MNLVLVVCLGLVALTAAAPQRNTIDFLLELNQDVLDDEKETPASVRPLAEPQVTEGVNVPEDSVMTEEQADVQETPQDSTSTTSSPAENTARENSDENSEPSGESSNETNESSTKEDTTIRVFDEQENENVESKQQAIENSTPNPEVEQNVELRGQEEEAGVVQKEELSNQINTEEQDPQIGFIPDLGVTPNTINNNENRDVEIKPDQLFNHGTLVFDKTTIGEDATQFTTTTPYSGKKWNHDHGQSFGGWPKFGIHGTQFDNQFGGPLPHWHNWHNHDHGNNRNNEQHGDKFDFSNFHGQGYHRIGPWKWH